MIPQIHFLKIPEAEAANTGDMMENSLRRQANKKRRNLDLMGYH